ncbi:hypothetical protein COS18_01015, partial [Candidatus Falkowbacteria bacterium CG02_land_8_20_14_3_00_36_14]
KAENLGGKLKGRILLQVESKGEAWYIDPATQQRAYLGRPADAFRIMRELGLGISENNFNSYNGYAPKNLSGRILLRVEANGEAYYVNPTDLKMYYLGRPADAFKVMREKGLGITNEDLNTISVNHSLNFIEILSDVQNILGYDNAYKAIVQIYCHNSNYSIEKQGSGVIISPDGLIVTNNHVVETFILGGEICTGGIITKQNSYKPDYFFNINFINKEPSRDIAYGIIEDKNKKSFPYLKINYNIKIGEEVTAIGYPDIANGSINISKGTITSKTDIDNYDYILSDVNVSYGSSGGALINLKGELLGLPTQVESSELASLVYVLQINFLPKSIELNNTLKKSMSDEYKYLFDDINNYLNKVLVLNNLR